MRAPIHEPPGPPEVRGIVGYAVVRVKAHRWDISVTINQALPLDEIAKGNRYAKY